MPTPDETDTVFTTDRLVVRRWRDSDLAALLAVYGDADAMRWVGDAQPLTGEEAERWLEVTASNYRLRGYGMFAMEDVKEGDVIGFCGIVHPGGQAEAEVKYALHGDHWGRGLATEAVVGLVRYGQVAHDLEYMIATVAPENAASQRVLVKAGFVRGEPRVHGDGTPTEVYEWTTPNVSTCS